MPQLRSNKHAKLMKSGNWRKRVKNKTIRKVASLINQVKMFATIKNILEITRTRNANSCARQFTTMMDQMFTSAYRLERSNLNMRD